MTSTIQQFFAMGGYAQYVWPAYGITLILLSLQLWLPWRRWRHFVRDQKNKKT